MSMIIAIMGLVLTVMLTALGIVATAWMWHCIRREKLEMIIHLREYEAMYGDLAESDKANEDIEPADSQDKARVAYILNPLKHNRRLN